MVVVSPSYKRAGNISVRRFYPDTVLAVHEFEAGEYKKKDGEPILIIPDSLRGNMGKVRNFIVESFGDVVMLDDDVVSVGRFDSRVNDFQGKSYDKNEFESFVDHGFRMAEELGVCLWGVNLQSDPKFYRAYSPFSFLSPVLGPFSCIRKNPIRYDERLSLNEDYDYFLQHIQRYHKTLRFNCNWYKAGHLSQRGGCGAYRTMKEEKAQSDLMIQKWGRGVVRYDLKKSTNPRLRVPINGI